MDVIGLLFSLSLVAALIVAGVKFFRGGREYPKSECRFCEHFLDNTCQIPDKENMANCRAFRRHIRR